MFDSSGVDWVGPCPTGERAWCGPSPTLSPSGIGALDFPVSTGEQDLTYRVVFAEAACVAPADVVEEARSILADLLGSLALIPSDSVFWDSMRASRLCLVVRGWSFLYGFEGETLRVTEVRRAVR